MQPSNANSPPHGRSTTPPDLAMARVHAALASLPEVDLAYVFGSVASGRARTDSDVDVAVWATKPLDTATRMAMIETLTLATGRPVDLVDLHDVGEPLLGQILKYGKRVIGDASAHAGLMIRHVYAMEDFVPYVTRMLKERRQAWTP